MLNENEVTQKTEIEESRVSAKYLQEMYHGMHHK